MNIALVKNNIIENIIVMDSFDEEFLELIKQDNFLDSYFIVEEYPYPLSIGCVLDASDNLWKPQNKKYSSWIFVKETGTWEPPIEYPGVPEDPKKYWAWNEEILNWNLLDIPIPPSTGSIPNA